MEDRVVEGGSSQFVMEIGVAIVEEIEVSVRIGGVDEPDETSIDHIQGRNGGHGSTKEAAGHHQLLDSLHRLHRLGRHRHGKNRLLSEKMKF